MSARSLSTNVPIRKASKRSRLAELLASIRPASVDPALRDHLARELAPVSSGYLRELLRASGVPLHPLVEGVRQDSFEDLERTLVALAVEYAATARKMDCRRLVIEAKDHARLGLRRWNRTWLPPLASRR